MSESQGHSYLKEHQLSGDAVLIDLNEQAESVLGEARQNNVGHAARTLIKDGPLRMTIVGFRQDGALREHKAPGPVSIDVLNGAVEVTVGDRTQRLSEHQTLVLGGSIEHSVTAPGDAVILLTIAAT